MNGRRLSLVVVLATAVAAGCAGKISFDNATPGTPQRIEGKLYRPDGRGPFPALVLLHGCQGVVRQTETWAHWLRERGYVALVMDSFGPRNEPADCKDGGESGPSTARFDDAIGALRYLQTQPFVIPDRVASFGWSQGGLFAMSVINGPTLERARARGVALPRAGYAAAIAMYPGGCRDYAKELVIRPLLLLIGGADNWTPPQYCREMAAAMKARGADVTLV
jgi:dienelactone hydrolase